jgi:hypothetical protein
MPSAAQSTLFIGAGRSRPFIVANKVELFVKQVRILANCHAIQYGRETVQDLENGLTIDNCRRPRISSSPQLEGSRESQGKAASP